MKNTSKKTSSLDFFEVFYGDHGGLTSSFPKSSALKKEMPKK